MSRDKISCHACEDSIKFVDKHDHGHEHSNNFEDFDLRKEVSLIVISTIFLVVGMIFEASLDTYQLGFIPKYIIFLAAYVISGIDVLKATLKNILHGEIFDENFLMTLATIGAIITNNLSEAVVVMVFYKTGEILQDYSVNKSKKSIQSLLDIRPKFANVVKGENIEEMLPDDVGIGEIIVVRPGEKVPLDGIIMNSSSKFDTSPLTGESAPKRLNSGDIVLAGVINLSDKVEIKTTKLFENSSIARIMNLIEHAEENKANTAKFITKFARYYTPAVVFIALLIVIIPPLAFSGEIWGDWIYRGMIFLVISCPCALVISIPLGYFGGIGGASKNGILVKGANFLDILANVDTVLFDKTGTLTKGNFSVTDIIKTNNYNEDKMLELAAHAEYHSTHPIANSVIEAYQGKIKSSVISEFTNVPAHGITATVDGASIVAGNDKILHKFNIPHDHDYCSIEGTVIHMSVNDVYSGYLLISDDIKDEGISMVKELRKLGIKNLTILSGDELCIVENIAEKLNIDEFYGCLLPEDKVEHLRMKKKKHGKVAFVGDGINDAPVMAYSDVGIVMGALGSEAAIETADIVLMKDSLSQIPKAIKIARKTQRIVWQNIIMVFIVKVLFMILGAMGLAGMWEAIFADVGMALLAIFNATRVLHFKNN